MNALTRWNQLRLNQLNKELWHGLRSLLGRSCVGLREQHLSRAPQWIPVVAVSEDAHGYLIKAELPQVKEKDVKIAIEDSALTITGDRKFAQNGKKNHCIEHAYGRFSHSFELPADARPAKVTTIFQNGVLIVNLARNEVIRPRRVECNLSFYEPSYSRSDWAGTLA
jgi:HSP20 family protein